MKIIRINHTQSDLVFELFDKYRQFYKQLSNIELAKKFIQERIDNNESVIFVALIEFKPVGFTQLYPLFSSLQAVRNWLLNDLYVDREYRKKGIGEKLIKTAINFANEKNAKFIELSTAVDNYNAQSLYKQIGFKKQNTETNFFTYRINLQ